MHLNTDFLKAGIIFRRLLTYNRFALHYMLIRNRNMTINHVILHASKIVHVRNRITPDRRENFIRKISNAVDIELIFRQQRLQHIKLKNLD